MRVTTSWDWMNLLALEFIQSSTENKGKVKRHAEYQIIKTILLQKHIPTSENTTEHKHGQTRNSNPNNKRLGTVCMGQVTEVILHSKAW